jgi:hypothetical protein
LDTKGRLFGCIEYCFVLWDEYLLVGDGYSGD